MSAAARLGSRAGGRWRLVGLVGQGLSGVVYEARDVLSGARQALKVMAHASGLSDRALDRLCRRAADLTAAHPAFVPVVATGRLDDGLPFVVTPFVRGTSWAHRLDRRGWLSAEEVADRIAEAAEPIDGARAVRLSHGHLHPGNVWTPRDGGVAVTDGGLGALHPESQDDLRALARTAFELLTGVPPDGRSALLLRRAPAPVARALERGLSERPGYDSASELAAALGEGLRGA